MFKVVTGVAAMLAVAIAPGAVAQISPSGVTRGSAPPVEATQPPSAPPPLSSYYPQRAQREEITGQAIIECDADAESVLRGCQVWSEKPEGWDFGVAAIKAAHAGSIRKAAEKGRRILIAVAFSAQGGVTYSSMPGSRIPPIRVAGPVVTQAARGNQPLVSFPFAFNRTSVLTADVTGQSVWVRGVLAPAGSPGFYAGTVRWPPAKVIGDVWCFLPAPVKNPGKTVCLMLLGRLAIILPNANPYAVTDFASAKGADNFATAPSFEEKPALIPGELRMEYRFRRWKDSYAEVEQWAGGRRLNFLQLPQHSDGRAKLETLAGDYWLSPAPGDPTRVAVSVAAP